MLLLDVSRQGRLEVRTEVTKQALIFLCVFLIKFWCTCLFVPRNITAWKLLETNVTFNFLVLSFVIIQTFLIVAGFPTNVTDLGGLVVDLSTMFDKSSVAFELSSALTTNQIWTHFVVIIIIIFFDFKLYLGLNIVLFRLIQL